VSSRQSWWLKVDRAEQHHHVIEAELKTFTQTDPLTLRSKHNLEGTEQTLRFIYSVEALKTPPESWAFVFGDAVQNLRAALDHVVWALVVKRKGAKFADRHARKINFPIADDLARFPRARLAEIGLRAPAITIIQNAQPYIRQQNAPRADALWLLQALSNVDKHRLLHTVVVIGETTKITSKPFLANGKVEFLERGALQKGTRVVRFTATRPATNGKVEVKCEVHAGICIEATPETDAVPIDLALRVMRERVTEILLQLAP
jgi:hypothetical protein